MDRPSANAAASVPPVVAEEHYPIAGDRDSSC